MKTSAAIVALFFCVLALAAGQEINENENQMQPVSEPPIKLIHVLNPGEREYLSPNLIGVQNIAMSFLPLKINFVNVIDAYREIVDGVRYEIHLNAIDTRDKDAEIICRLVILEKPWLRTEWGDKVRELQHSNCTSEEENLADPVERSAALNDKYTRNAFFNGGSRNELSDDDMSKLESQILSSSSGVKRRATTTSTTTTTTTEKQQVASQHVAQANNNDNDSGTNSDDADTQQLLLTTSTEDSSQAEEATTQPPELSDAEVKWLDDILSVGALNFENSHNNNKKHNEAETTESNDSTDADQNNYSQKQLANVETRVNANEDTQKQQQQLELATSEQVKSDGNQ